MADNYVALLEKERPSILKMLPDYINGERWFALALELGKNPKLLAAAQKNPASLIAAVKKVATWGLELGTDEVYLIPYGDTVEAQADYKGMIRSAVEAGIILNCYGEIVREGDYFQVMGGTSRRIVHRPAPLSVQVVGPIIGSYAVAQLPSGLVDFEVFRREDIEAIRAQSLRMNKGVETPAWKFWFGQMSKKGPIRRLLKRLRGKRDTPAGERFAVLMASQNQYEKEPEEIEIIGAPVVADDPGSAPPPLEQGENKPKGAVAAARPEARSAPSNNKARKPVPPPPEEEQRPKLTDDQVQDIKNQLDAMQVKMSVAFRVLERFDAQDVSDLYSDQMDPYIKAVQDEMTGA